MKNVALVFLLFFSFQSLGQLPVETEQEDATTLFAQGLFTISSQEEMLELETTLRENFHTKIVRLDWNTERFFILTKEIENLSEAELRSWFTEYGNDLSCIQIGVYGTDTMNTYPFENCNSEE